MCCPGGLHRCAHGPRRPSQASGTRWVTRARPSSARRTSCSSTDRALRSTASRCPQTRSSWRMRSRRAAAGRHRTPDPALRPRARCPSPSLSANACVRGHQTFQDISLTFPRAVPQARGSTMIETELSSTEVRKRVTPPDDEVSAQPLAPPLPRRVECRRRALASPPYHVRIERRRHRRRRPLAALAPAPPLAPSYRHHRHHQVRFGLRNAESSRERAWYDPAEGRFTRISVGFAHLSSL